MNLSESLNLDTIPKQQRSSISRMCFEKKESTTEAKENDEIIICFVWLMSLILQQEQNQIAKSIPQNPPSLSLSVPWHCETKH